jgi:molecular chaperone DnaJ
MRNFYDILEVPRNASGHDIKRAYHRLAHRNHPDKNGGDPAAEGRFRDVRQAYGVLSDPSRRRRYDLFGPAGVGLGGQPSFAGVDFAQNLGAAVGDIFQGLFGRGRSAAQTDPAAPPPTPLSIGLGLALTGGPAHLTLIKRQHCAACTGTGAKAGTASEACSQCAGAGALRVQQGLFSIRKRCPGCSGSGQHIRHPCPGCAGSGRISREANLRVIIPSGAQTGTTLRLRGEGEPLPDGRHGDLLVRLTVAEHALFRREGSDLHCTWPITMIEAALGGAARIPLPDGRHGTVAIPAGTQDGAVLTAASAGAQRLRGEGHGTLFVTVQVEVPQDLAAAAREHLAAIETMVRPENYPRLQAAQRAFKQSADV